MKKAYILPNEQLIRVPKFCEENGFYATEKSSKTMSKIKSSSNKTELVIRRNLTMLGVRYRLQPKNIPGKPDLAFSRHKLVVFIDGDFWHGKDWEHQKQKLNTNREFWLKKIERNRQRDRAINQILKAMGYTVLRFWESEACKNPGLVVTAILRELERGKTHEEP